MARTRCHTFRPDAAVVLDTPRLYRVEHNRAGIATLAGRTQVPLNIGGVQRRQLAEAAKLGEASRGVENKVDGLARGLPEIVGDAVRDAFREERERKS